MRGVSQPEQPCSVVPAAEHRAGSEDRSTLDVAGPWLAASASSAARVDLEQDEVLIIDLRFLLLYYLTLFTYCV